MVKIDHNDKKSVPLEHRCLDCSRHYTIFLICCLFCPREVFFNISSNSKETVFQYNVSSLEI